MKIVHLTSSDNGGAGNAARRLHEALLKAGADSTLLCKSKTTTTPGIIQYQESTFSKIMKRLSFIPYRQNKYAKYLYGPNKLSGYESYSFPEAIYDVSSHPLLKTADIINLHWVGSGINYPKFFARIKKPIVWTLHDMNPFLGLSHFKFDRENNPQNEGLEQSLIKIKSDAIHQHANLHIVNLCSWMKDYSSKSSAFANVDQRIIFNSIDTQIYKYLDKDTARETLGLPKNKKIFLFICQYLSNLRKGFKLLQNVIESCDFDDILFLSVGAENPTGIKHNIYSLGSISDEKYLATVYSAADALILPSIEDNLPNTMVESLCCGTPVISFSNGGMRDVIKTGENGILIKDQSSESLAKAMKAFIDNSDNMNPIKISESACDLFSPIRQAENYLSFYNNILATY